MTEYIEREAAFNALLKLIPKVDDDGYCWVIRGDAATAIDSIPAADVRPVVLCRDCIHFQQFRAHDGFCQIDGMLWNNDFFCANGKREGS